MRLVLLCWVGWCTAIFVSEYIGSTFELTASVSRMNNMSKKKINTINATGRLFLILI